ncbi:protein translocase subunit SecF, partial [bacterium]|nr:protein translocase subunit SecF [bacterium]
AIIIVLFLFLFGGEVIHDFAFTLLVGIVAGTYSTVYIASPVVLLWEKHFAKSK